MPSEVNDGGSVLPFWRYDPEGDDEPGRPTLIWRGMSLRDYFAAKAMQAIIAKFPPELVPKNGDCSAEKQTALGAYFYADAMLAARSKGGEA